MITSLEVYTGVTSVARGFGHLVLPDTKKFLEF